jgi:hypothetical protein
MQQHNPARRAARAFALSISGAKSLSDALES